MDHFTVTFKPDNRAVSIRAGATLLQAAEYAGIILNTVCGRKGTCRKCSVFIELTSETVLACQYKVSSDLTVTVPHTSRYWKQKILSDGIAANIQAAPAILKTLPTAISAETNPLFGVAIDLGTTTIVAKLFDLTTAALMATASIANPQIKYGDDVIARITHGSTTQGLDQLHSTIIDGINQLIAELCTQANVKANDIYEVTVASNTTMNHILLKLPIIQLGQAPYKAHSIQAHDKPAPEIKLNINPAGQLHTIENIAGFVGSDTVAVAVAVGMDKETQRTLIVDIGTNGEIILGTKDRMLASSCAAGPAFEGARIDQGSRAVNGAIEAVFINDDDIAIDVIGSIPAQSICGSGLLDALAVLLDLGIVDSTGRLSTPEGLFPKIAARIVEYNNAPAFALADGVVLTQKDVRETQLAKAAIRTGIALLQKELQLPDEDIDQILLAGAFGNYIRRESALRIGLLPKVPVDKVKFVGNAAATGAQMNLLNFEYRELSKWLASQIEYIEIAARKDFQDTFAEALMFDE